MSVDHDRTVENLLDTFVNGNRTEVVDNLSKRHPAITALFFLQAQVRGLPVEDLNLITNQLMDNLIEVRDSKGLEFTGRPLD